MQKYIERDAVIKYLTKCADGYSYIETPTESAIAHIKAIPAADVVEVVRCKDCKWYQLDPWGYKVQCEKIYDVADGDLDGFNFRPSPDHFCAYGERKEVNTVEPVHP